MSNTLRVKIDVTDEFISYLCMREALLDISVLCSGQEWDEDTARIKKLADGALKYDRKVRSES